MTVRAARNRDADYPDVIPEHWTAIADRRLLLAKIDQLRSAIERFRAANDAVLLTDSSWTDSQVDRVLQEYHFAEDALGTVLSDT